MAMSDDSATELARRTGLTRLSEKNIGNLVLSKAIAERVLMDLRRDLPSSEEPAIVFNPAVFVPDER
jgi:hypothetical protein